MDLRRILDGFVVVAIGVVLLGNTTGVLPWSAWWNILMLWPLLLVAAGIDIIGRSTDNSWLRILSGLLVLGGIAFGAYAGLASPGDPGRVWVPFVRSAPAEPFSFSEPADEAIVRGKVRIDSGVGRLSVEAGDDLIASEGETPFGEPVFDIDRAADTVEARVTNGSGRDADGWLVGRDARLGVRLGKDLDWVVVLNAGVSRVDIDLSELRVSDLEVDMGVSSGELTLGEPLADGSTANIDTGVSSVNLRVPEGASVEISAEDGLGNVRVPDGFERIEGDRRRWRTREFNEDGDVWRVRIKAGVATVDVDVY